MYIGHHEFRLERMCVVQSVHNYAINEKGLKSLFKIKIQKFVIFVQF